ncbi:hypothetical protein [Providencia phage PSTRCR_114]|uniref:Uncharacterized protein n=1 Tax=Providencia phage PSTRCR_114 TaxID=2800824 RepID=A0A7T6ZMJ5_9CAUD|nr:hypothetical protein [Providencia phage PSTRCR_114]
MNTQTMIKHVKKVVWDLTGDKEKQADRVLEYLLKRLNRDSQRKQYQPTLNFIQCKEHGYLMQTKDGYWYDELQRRRFASSTEAVNSINQYLQDTAAII